MKTTTLVKLRSAAGYRLYDRDDLLRLQQILIGRELGLTLQEIGRSLDDPAFDLRQALRSQREQLQGCAERVAAMLRAVDAASVRRASRYTAEDWARCKAESEQIYAAAAAAMTADTAAQDTAATAVAERHRLHIDRWFYPCSREMHARLADMYEADSRFAQTIDRYSQGLTGFLSAAIRANAAQLGRRSP